MITRIQKVCIRFVRPADGEAERCRRVVAELQARSILLAAGVLGEDGRTIARNALDSLAPPCPHVGKDG